MGDSAQLHQFAVLSSFARVTFARGVGRGGHQQRANSRCTFAECLRIYTRVSGVFTGITVLIFYKMRPFLKLFQ